MNHAKKIKLFEFFGFTNTHETTHELIGTCLFCGKENHFYLNKERAIFDCKKCGFAGNYTDFLTQIYEDLKPHSELNKLIQLADHRRIPFEAFNDTGIIALNEKYWIPIYNEKNKVQDLRYYTLGQKIYSIEGAELGIFNLKDLLDQNRRDEAIYVSEGEFDAIALKYLLKKTNKSGIVIGIPGARVLKNEWHDYFKGRDLINCYDNDGAGEQGFSKAKERLNGYTSLKRIFWPEDMPKGYDVNEFVSTYGVQKNNYDLCYQILTNLIKDEKGISVAVTDNKYSNIPDNISFQDLLAQYRTVLKVNSEYEDAIRVMLATILSVNIKGSDPLWIYFVGPPSCGKTALLNTTRSCNFTHYESSLSRHMLISGWRTPNGLDPSILAKVNNKCFVLKDFTEVLFKSSSDRDEIFGVLRGAFDGFVERSFGNGIIRNYQNLNFSMLAGVTQEINSYPQASAGERFLRYNFSYDESNIEKQQEMALSKALFGDEEKQELQIWVNKFLTKDFNITPERVQQYLTPEFRNRLIPLARLVGYLRTPVIRFEKGRKSELPIYDPIAETGNRVAIQLQRLAVALAIVEDKQTIDDDVYRILKKVAFDTVEGFATRILVILYKKQKELTQGEITLNLTRNTSPMNIRPYLDDLTLLNLINAKPIGASDRPILAYHLTDKIFELFARVEHG